MSPARRILVVDDEGEIVQVLSGYFIQQGDAVETAANGTEALAALARQPADVEKPFDFVALGRSVASALARRGAT
jgi:CheY-like chemotaxis protein